MNKLVYILILFFPNLVWTQNKTEKQTVDRHILTASNHTNVDSSFHYYKKALRIARDLDYFKGQEQSCIGIIDLFKDEKVLDNSLRYNLVLVDLYEKFGKPSDKVKSYIALGSLYNKFEFYQNASKAYRTAFDIDNAPSELKYTAGLMLVRSLKKDGHPNEALLSAREIQFIENLSDLQQKNILIEKAEIYHQLKAYTEELETYNSMVGLLKYSNDKLLLATVWNNIGFVHKYLKNFSASKKAFEQAILITKDNDLLATSHYNLGLMHHNQNKIDSAFLHFSRAEEFFRKSENWSSLANSLNMQAMSFYKMDDFYNAQKRLDMAFSTERKYLLKHEEAKSHEIQSLFFEAQYDYENALTSYKKYLFIRDSLLRSEESGKFLRIYEKDRLEQERLNWASEDLEDANLSKERALLAAKAAELATEQERSEKLISEKEASIQRARAELKARQLIEEQLKLKNKQDELLLTEKEKVITEGYLKEERLLVAANEQKIQFLNQKNELERQKRLNDEQEYENKLRLIFAAFLFISIILLGIIIAYRQLRKRKQQIEKQSQIIAESKREIEIQKEKSESLLLNILPQSIADELKLHGSAKPKSYGDVSVGFTDFSGFTMISEKLSPEQLVHKLDEMFLAFDGIIERHGLQRIKTIGDAYMFAAGLPEPLENHAWRSVKAAIDMRDYITTFNASLPMDSPQWNIRIGVHTGPVVAGVIGIKKFAFDIWGDTVNTASRMESSGEIGKVNISESTYNIVKDDFITEHRGKVKAKNKGEIEMYFVENKK